MASEDSRLLCPTTFLHGFLTGGFMQGVKPPLTVLELQEYADIYARVFKMSSQQYYSRSWSPLRFLTASNRPVTAQVVGISSSSTSRFEPPAGHMPPRLVRLAGIFMVDPSNHQIKDGMRAIRRLFLTQILPLRETFAYFELLSPQFWHTV